MAAPKDTWLEEALASTITCSLSFLFFFFSGGHIFSLVHCEVRMATVSVPLKLGDGAVVYQKYAEWGGSRIESQVFSSDNL